jgi:hypothetical protein
MVPDKLSLRVSLQPQVRMASPVTGITERGSAQWNSVGITLYGNEDYTIEDYTDVGIMKRVPPIIIINALEVGFLHLKKGGTMDFKW